MAVHTTTGKFAARSSWRHHREAWNVDDAEAITMDVAGMPVTVRRVPPPLVEEQAHCRMPAAQPGRRADEGFKLSDGIIYEHAARDLGTAQRSLGQPSDAVCVYPTTTQIGALADALRSRELTAVSIGAGEGFLEALLEQAGVQVVAIEPDVLRPDDYRGYGCFCTAIRRVPPDCLYRIPEPEHAALLFVWGRALPWRAYLARYPTVPLVAIVGDPAHGGSTEPSASALNGSRCWRRVLCQPMRARMPHATLAIYERIMNGRRVADGESHDQCGWGPQGFTAGGQPPEDNDELTRAVSTRPRMAPSYKLSMSPNHLLAQWPPGL